MHEIGVLYKMVEQVEAVAKQQNLEQIAVIEVEVGELSGILPVFLEKYYPIVIENKVLFEASELCIQVIPGQALCCDCQTLYNVMKIEGTCPKCESREKTILGGREFILKNIIIRQNRE